MEHETPKASWWRGWRDEEYTEPLEHRLLEQRLGRLEKENRVYRYLFALTAVLIAGLVALNLLYAPARGPGEVVRARRVEVVNEQGREGVVLSTDRAGGRIALRFNAEGEPPPPAMFLAAGRKGGSMQIFEQGHNFYAFSAGIGPQGEAVLEVRARDMRDGVTLRGTSGDDTGGALVVFDKQGDPAVRVGAEGSGRGFVRADGRAAQ